MSDTAPAKSTEANSNEPVQVEQASFSCDGGGGALGHPTVQLTLDKSGRTRCSYCGVRFELKPGANADAGH